MYSRWSFAAATHNPPQTPNIEDRGRGGGKARLRLGIGVVVALCNLLAQNAMAGSTSHEPYVGLHGASFGVGQYGNPAISPTSTDAEESLRQLASTGANVVSIPIVWYQNTTNATHVFPITGSSPLRTVSDAEVAHLVSLAHEVGLATVLQLVLDLNWDIRDNLMSFDPLYPGAECLFYSIKKSLGFPVPPKPPVCPSTATSRAFIGCNDVPRKTNTPCSAQISNSSWETWFASYTSFAVHYAGLAEQLNVSTLDISNGLTTANVGHDAHWRSTVAQVRSVFEGHVTATVKISSANTVSAELGIIDWWNETDFIGVDLQVPLNSTSGGADELTAAWKPVVHALQRFSDNVRGRSGNRIPIFITRWGYQSRIFSWQHPAGAPRNDYGGDCSVYMTCNSMISQTSAYEAFFRAFLETSSTFWLAGSLLWLWRNDPSQGGTSGTDFTPVGKPALAIAQSYWKKVRPGTSHQYSVTSKTLDQRYKPVDVALPTTQAKAFVRPQNWTKKLNGICFGIGEWSSTESPSANLDSTQARQSLRDAVAVGVNR